jgi:hypothetical protein
MDGFKVKIKPILMLFHSKMLVYNISKIVVIYDISHTNGLDFILRLIKIMFLEAYPGVRK